MSDRRNDIQIGLFSIIGVLLLAMMILVFGGFKDFLADTYTVTAYFPTAAGTAEGTPVRLRGIEVGNVKSISLAADRAGVMMKLAIRKNISIEADAPLTIRQEGFIANIYLEFSSGTSAETLAKDGTAEVEGGISTFASYVENAGMVLSDMGVKIGDRVAAVTEGLSDLTKNLNDITGDETFRSDVKEFASNANSIAGELKNKLPALIDNLNAAAEDAQERIAQASEVFETYRKLGEELSVTNEVARGEIEKVGAEIDELMDSLLAAADNFGELSANLNGVVVSLKEGQGTVGRLFTDDELYRKVVESIDTLTAATEDIKDLVNTIKRHPDWLITGPPADRR